MRTDTQDYTQDIHDALRGIIPEAQQRMVTQHGQHSRTVPLYVVLDSTGSVAGHHDIPELLAMEKARGYTLVLASNWRAAQ